MNCLLPVCLILLNIDANLSAVSFVRSGSRRPRHLSVWLLSCCLIIDNLIQLYYCQFNVKHCAFYCIMKT